jgi:hypothetical protein
MKKKIIMMSVLTSGAFIFAQKVFANPVAVDGWNASEQIPIPEAPSTPDAGTIISMVIVVAIVAIIVFIKTRGKKK